MNASTLRNVVGYATSLVAWVTLGDPAAIAQTVPFPPPVVQPQPLVDVPIVDAGRFDGVQSHPSFVTPMSDGLADPIEQSHIVPPIFVPESPRGHGGVFVPRSGSRRLPSPDIAHSHIGPEHAEHVHHGHNPHAGRSLGTVVNGSVGRQNLPIGLHYSGPRLFSKHPKLDRFLHHDGPCDGGLDGSCDGFCATGCGVNHRPHYWLRGEYLYWFMDGADAPPLVTTSSPGTVRTDAGVIGLLTTTTLFGGEIGENGRSGGRIEFGRVFPSRGGLGFHVAYLGLDDDRQQRTFDSSAFPILARPFVNVEPGSVGNNAELVAFPGEVSGNVTVTESTEFEAVEVMLRRPMLLECDRRIYLMGGFGYASLEDALAVSDFKRVTGSGSGLAIGTTLAERDSFETDNEFRGGIIGVLASIHQDLWSFETALQLGLGSVESTVRIDGSTTATVPIGTGTQTATTRGGLLALGENLGTFEDDQFAVMPQLHARLGYQILPRLRGTVGYRFLYLSQVARAAEQIDTGVNLSQLDPAGANGEVRPVFAFNKTDFWAQGLTLGLDLMW